MAARSQYLLIVAALLVPGTARAQWAEPPRVAEHRSSADDLGTPSLQDGPTFTGLRVAKWTTLAASLGSAGWALWSNARADERYAELERTCVADPDRCASRNADGSFSDLALEDAYQRVLRLDRNTRWAFVAGQVGVLASVALFVLDMRGDDEPTVIPYTPSALRVAPAVDGGVSVGVRVPYPTSNSRSRSP